MRALGVVLVLAAATTVYADGAKLIDLDKDEDAVWRLAEAAGACNKRHPAFIKTWCHSTNPTKARFTQRFDTKVTDAGKGKVSVTFPVTEHGKGFVSTIGRPRIKCQMDGCLPESDVTVLIRTKVAAADVRVVTVAFDVSSMWRDRQWWGPMPTKVAFTLWNAAGAQLGEGTLAGTR